MSPFTHLFVSWLIADSFPSLSTRERTLVTLAGVVPDVDGAGAVVELLTRDTERPLLWFSEYHHLLHNIVFAALVAIAAALLSRNRALVALLSFLTFHVHLLCDLVGARGPDGAQWPVPYLFPLRADLLLSWEHQWSLNAWPNFAITGIAMTLIAARARLRGYSPVGMVSVRADRAFVEALRGRFPLPAAPRSPSEEDPR